MATLICPNCGAENVLSIEGVCECEYCGTVVTNTPCNSVNIPQNDTDRSETFLTGILSISEDEAIKIAKDYVTQQLKEVLKDEDEDVYKYFLSPLSKRFGELKFSVKLFYVPAFFFKGEGLENGNIVNYCFSCFAGNEHSYPKCLIDTVNFNTYFNIYYCNGIVFVNNDSINSNTQRLFIKNPMNNGVLTRKSYDYADSDCEWVYDMDVYGNVARITMTCLGSDGSGFKTEHTYTYAQSERHPWRNVIEDNEIEFARLSRAETFTRNNNNDIRKFEYRDGIIWEVTHREQFPNKYTDKQFNSVAQQFNFNVKNDTNIDFWQLWFPRTSNITIVALTEWLCLRPDYLMKDVGSHYEYEYDNDGNLIKITDRSWDMKYVYKEIKIKYLY